MEIKWNGGTGACVFPFSLSGELENGRLFPGRSFDTWKTRASAKKLANTNAAIIAFIFLV